MPAAGDIPASAILSSIKAFKYAVQVLFTNSRAFITYLYQNMFFIQFIHAGNNFTSIFTIFDRIIQEVDNYLAYFFFIGKNCQWSFTSFFYTETDILTFRFQ